MAKSKLNGSVDRLAEALRDVIREGAAEAVDPLGKQIKTLNTEVGNLGKKMDDLKDRVDRLDC